MILIHGEGILPQQVEYLTLMDFLQKNDVINSCPERSESSKARPVSSFQIPTHFQAQRQ
jgi:hypothetical protein